MNYLKIGTISLVMIALTGCLSTPNGTSSAQPQPSTSVKNPIYSDQEWLGLVTELNQAGQGRITNCSFKTFTSELTTSYSNSRNEPNLSISARDEHLVNSVYLHLYSDELQEFEEILRAAAEKAKTNDSIEHLSLGRYSKFKTEVTFASRYGDLFGFWVNSPDQVLTPINANELLQCMHQVSNHL